MSLRDAMEMFAAWIVASNVLYELVMIADWVLS